MRGDNLGSGSHNREYFRFTPTCVGTTRLVRNPQFHRKVHPHVRGDNYKGATCCGVWLGSPPRAWGQPRYVCCLRPILRFTPTCVGTTDAKNLFLWIS